MWVRIDDQYPEHPKVVAAGPLASQLHLCAICYSNRLKTGGFIPFGKIETLVSWNGTKSGGQPVNSLTLIPLLTQIVPGQEFPMWITVEGGYRIHDYEKYQTSTQPAGPADQRAGGKAPRWSPASFGGKARVSSAIRGKDGRFRPSDQRAGDIDQRAGASVLDQRSSLPVPVPIAGDSPIGESCPVESSRKEKEKGKKQAREEVVAYYVQKTPGRRSYHLSQERSAIIDLAVGFVGVDGCMKLIDLFAEHPKFGFYRGENPDGTKYLGLCEYILSHRLKKSAVIPRIEEHLAKAGLSLE